VKFNVYYFAKGLKALSVDNGWSRLIVLLLGDPHLLEGGERSQDRSSDPYRVFPLWGSDDLNLHGRGSKGSKLLLESVSNTGEHSGSSRADNVSIEILSDINVALHDGVISGLVDSGSLHSEERGLEKSLRATESLVTNGDDLSVGKLVGLLKGRRGSSSLHLLLEVKGNIGEFLLNITDDLTFSSGGERITTLGEDLHEVISKISSSEIETEDGVGKSITLIDGDSVGYTITRVHNDSGGSSRSIEGQDGLDGDVHGGGVEGLEHDLSHLLTIGLGVKGGLSEEDRVLLRGNSELIVEGVMPDLLHIIPVGHNSVLNGVFQGEDSSLGLGLISYIGVLLSHTNHHSSMSWATDNGGKDGSGSIVSCKSGFAHS